MSLARGDHLQILAAHRAGPVGDLVVLVEHSADIRTQRDAAFGISCPGRGFAAVISVSFDVQARTREDMASGRVSDRRAATTTPERNVTSATICIAAGRPNASAAAPASRAPAT